MKRPPLASPLASSLASHLASPLASPLASTLVSPLASPLASHTPMDQDPPTHDAQLHKVRCQPHNYADNWFEQPPQGGILVQKKLTKLLKILRFV